MNWLTSQLTGNSQLQISYFLFFLSIFNYIYHSFWWSRQETSITDTTQRVIQYLIKLSCTSQHHWNNIKLFYILHSDTVSAQTTHCASAGTYSSSLQEFNRSKQTQKINNNANNFINPRVKQQRNTWDTAWNYDEAFRRTDHFHLQLC